MEVLDEQGRLFGRVNVVDALVVLFAVAVIVAGAALVFGDKPASTPDSDQATLYVTLATDGEATTTLDDGEVQFDGASANVTDVYRTRGPRTYFRVALNGTETDEGFRFHGHRVRLGDTYTVTDNTTRTDSRVVERDVAPEFETRTTTVTVETSLRTPVAEAVAAGDEWRIDDDPVLTVTSAETEPVNETHTRLRATLDLETRVVEDVSHYGGRVVRLGRDIVVVTNDYEFGAEIVGRG
jgi:hypothetical protein